MTEAWRLEAPVSYTRALAWQEALLRRRIADEIPDTILLLQHTPVITLGRRGRRDSMLVSDEELHRRGIDLVRASRGGDVTWHGPGQIVVYPICRLLPGHSHGWLDLLEESVVRTVRRFGVEAFTRPGMAGAWTESGKIAAIGFALKKWVSYHGLSLNVDCALEGFDLIVGCGLQGEKVTSLRECLPGETHGVQEVETIWIDEYAKLRNEKPVIRRVEIGELDRLLSDVGDGAAGD